MKGYKGFNPNLQCRGFQYELGKEYVQEHKISCCENGFHFCERPLDVFSYYPPADSRYCEVEGDGDIDRDNNDSKVACSKLRIGIEIGLRGLIEAGVKFILEKVDWQNQKESQSEECSAATNTGYQSAATNTGDYSAATNTGYQSAATNTGDYSAATNTGNKSAATNTGNKSAATNTGNKSAATNTGYQSAATNTGYQSAATNTGYQSAATNTGYQSAATNTGDYSAASVDGKESVACSLGIEGKAKGALGCWIVCAEWRYDKNAYEWHRSDVQCIKVDGEVIKADTWYRLLEGQFVEVEEEEE
jgi:hypothetical protein